MRLIQISHAVVRCLLVAFPGSLLAVDTDGDGLDDSVETNTGIYVSRFDTGTNPLVADSDGDGVGDWYEVVTVEEAPSGVQTNAPNDPNVFPSRPYPMPEPDATPVVTNRPVKVYILSGQSNMQGFGEVFGSTSGTLTTITRTEGKFPQLLDGPDFRIRDDVKVRGVIGVGGNGPLGPTGFGSSTNRFGPEFGFGYVMGDYHDEPVLIIKSPKGGKDLGYQFLPPGSPQYVDGSLTFAGYGDSPRSWATGATPTPDATYAGEQWDECFTDEADWAPAGQSRPAVTNVTDILDNFAAEYPDWAAQGFEIAGFAWWQGYNDKQGSGTPVSYSERYGQNMAQFIKEIRKYFEARYPGQVATDAPFVLATLGEGGWGAKLEKHQNVIDGQLFVDGDTGNYPEFAGNVKTMETRGFWRDSSESPNNNTQAHHYNLNAETYLLAGDALGRGMVELKSAVEADTKAPVFITLDPSNQSPAVDSNSTLAITFSETIQIGSGNIVLKNLSDGTQTTIAVSDAGQITVSGFKMTIDPATPLIPNKSYAIRIESGALEDAAGNDFAGINDDTTWTFDSIPSDVTPPPVPVISFPTGASKVNQITLQADPVVDPQGYGVEYLFKNLTLGTDSGWGISPSWTNTGLVPGTRYVYAVQSRDVSPGMNESADSPLRSAKTLAEAPSTGVVDVFTYKADLGPGGDNWNIDTGGASKPITIATDSFNPVGSDKLVGVISLFNSADSVSEVTSLTYAGVDVLSNVATGNPNGAAGFSGRRFIFYLDHPVADGDLVIGLGASDNVDEVGVALLALNGTRPGYTTGVSAGGNPAAINVFAGDFVVGVAQRNNQTQSVTNAPPYTSLDLRAGNLIAYAGYTVAGQDGPTAPVFSNTSGIAHSIAVFESMAPEPSAYETWASVHAPTTADDLEGDEDHDGVSNYMEFVLGGSGTSNDADKLPKLQLEADEMTFSFKRAQRSIGPAATMVIEMGDDLATWPNLYPVPDVATAGPPVTVEKDSSPGMDTVTLSVPMTPGVNKFARLKVAITP